MMFPTYNFSVKRTIETNSKEDTTDRSENPKRISKLSNMVFLFISLNLQKDHFMFGWLSLRNLIAI